MSRHSSNSAYISEAPPRFPPLSFSEEGRVRYLHFGSPWIQGAMHLNRPNEIVFEYVQQMMAWLLFLDQPQRIVQLGLGAAALTKFCYHHFAQSDVLAVELNPEVITAAHSMFRLPPDDARLTLVQADAGAFICQPHHRHWATVIQVDLYDEHARGPVLDSVTFYRACRAALQKPGMLTVNLFGDPENLPKSLQNLRDAFDGRILTFAPVHQGNVVVLAFNGPALQVTWEALYERAALLEQCYGWQVTQWLSGLRMLNPQGGKILEV